MKLKSQNLIFVKEKKIWFLFLLLFFSIKSSSQGFLITSPKLEFVNNQLVISYDLIGSGRLDQFYVWVEITDQNGNPLSIKTLSGDQGGNIKAGIGKKFSGLPKKIAFSLMN